MNITLEQAITKYNIPVPRYTSYPPANLFSARYTATDYIRDVQQSNHHGAEDISFYIHIPFCKGICHFCACNKQILPRQEGKVEEYIGYLLRELELLKPHIQPSRQVVQIHFGGGSPTSIPIKYISQIVQALTATFQLKDGAEVAIEAHPGYLTEADWQHLIALPFTRYSIGVQDFSEQVLTLAHRTPPQVPIQQIVQAIHTAGKSVNLDFIYGLPAQSHHSFVLSIQQAIAIRPDRLVTFSYAHVPWLHRQQLVLEKAGLPTSAEKEKMYTQAASHILSAGYQQVGLDHFVLPQDPLALAQNEHTLHRNFQGYCPKALSGQVYALGITGISQLFNSYAQNAKSLPSYYATINQGQLPIAIGYQLTPQEQTARDIITDLMCNYRTKPLHHYAHSLYHDSAMLQQLEADGLLYRSTSGELIVPPEAHLFVRNVAALFDMHYNPSNPKGYSKPI